MSSATPVGGSFGSLSSPSSRKWRRAWIALGVVLALVLIGWLMQGLLKPKSKPAGPQPIPVGTAAVAKGDLDVYLDAIGTVTPVYTATVVSRVAGEVMTVNFKEGQMVRKNDLLAIIDPRPYAAAELQAKGQLDRDVAALKNARIDLKRYQESFKVHAISEQQLRTQEAAVESDEGSVTLDQGNYAAAHVNVLYTRIVAPIEGRVGLRNIDPGNVVAANGTTGLCTITQLKPITVIFVIPEDSIEEVVTQMAAGPPLEVLALDRSKSHVISSGTLLTVDNQVNTTTGTVRARASFPNTRNELFPNQFVNARLRVRTLRQASLVPQAAIQRNGDIAFVYAVQPDQSVKSVNVKILATEGETSAVTGVEAGQVLVTDGFDKLQNGSKIVARKAPAGTPATRATPAIPATPATSATPATTPATPPTTPATPQAKPSSP